MVLSPEAEIEEEPQVQQRPMAKGICAECWSSEEEGPCRNPRCLFYEPGESAEPERTEAPLCLHGLA